MIAYLLLVALVSMILAALPYRLHFEGFISLQEFQWAFAVIAFLTLVIPPLVIIAVEIKSGRLSLGRK